MDTFVDTKQNKTVVRSLRSKNGCTTCRRRRVKCDEGFPRCTSCVRLGFDCEYLNVPRRKPGGNLDPSRKTPRPTSILPNATESTLGLTSPPGHPGQSFQSSQLDGATFNSTKATNNWQTSSQSTFCEPDPNFVSWCHADGIDFNHVEPDIYPSWAGHSLESPSNLDFPPLDITDQELQTLQVSLSLDDPSSAVIGRPDDQSTSSRTALPDRSRSPHPDTQTEKAKEGIEAISIGTNSGTDRHFSPQMNPRCETISHEPEAEHLLSLFTGIVQPPGAILISGVKNWRRVQRHLLAMSTSCEPVLQALLCVAGVLFIDETANYTTQDRHTYLRRVFERHRLAIDGVHNIASNKTQIDQASYEALLAAILLLAWYEVIRDQDGHAMPFPRGVAEVTVTSDVNWSRVSKQLLSWLCVLDGKATYSSGEPLLTESALRAVARYPIQIVSADAEELDSETEHDSVEARPKTSMTQPSPPSAGVSATLASPRVLTSARIKQVVLHSIVQPAVEWYISTQAFCRRIGSHDRHHRSRGTPDDEYAVIVASKQLEKDLWEVWRQRPTIMSLSRDELAQSLSPDLAIRLEELFNLHFASFWILFVYLHRVTWWHLPHSPTATAALNNVWQNLQKSYGEVVDGTGSKILHPGLLWPVFLFGTECPDKYRQTWAIEQLETLGATRPRSNSVDLGREDLPPFRVSPGATKNAKRAALLLKQLVKEQNECNTRVDDRQLSIQMFGCYFSIV